MPSQRFPVNTFPHPAPSVRPWCPPRPVPPPLGYRAAGDTFTVPGVAVVTAAPHRSRRQAQSLAERIADRPRDYLPVLTGLAVPGVVDRRPTSHADRDHAVGNPGTDAPRRSAGWLRSTDLVRSDQLPGRTLTVADAAALLGVPAAAVRLSVHRLTTARGHIFHRADDPGPGRGCGVGLTGCASLDHRGGNPDGPTRAARTPDRRAVDPAAAAGRAESLARLLAVLPAYAAAAVAQAWDGAELPADVAADLARRFTRDQMAAVLGLGVAA